VRRFLGVLCLLHLYPRKPPTSPSRFRAADRLWCHWLWHGASGNSYRPPGGIDGYYVIINAERGVVMPGMPAHTSGFNHVVLAIRLPDSVDDPSVIATDNDKQLGRLRYFVPRMSWSRLGRSAAICRRTMACWLRRAGAN